MGGGYLAVFFLVGRLSLSGGATDPGDAVIDSCELGPVLVPRLYELKFDLDFPSRRFDGEVTVTGRVLAPTRELLLDSAVTVHEALVSSPTETPIEGRLSSHDKTLQVEFERTLLPGQDYQLLLRFSGDIRSARGVYGANYTSVDDDERYFVATEFQPNYARYAFPCVDRPAYKAQYLLNVSREAHLVALSNTPRASSHPDAHIANKVWDSFEKTPPMSTYTFAFLVADIVPCEHEAGEDPANNTVWVIRGNERLAGIASKWAPLYMRHLEKYTDIKYDLPKLDHVALPYLASTGMENWGLITYKQEVLHLDVSNHTVKSEFGLIWILAHEMTHQWFGNLVTCSSWAYTWLNEGITSFLHFLVSGKVFPEWDMLGLMMSEEVLKVMDDEGFSAVSLTKDNCTMDASDTFSMASYYKGAALMRMVYYLLGDEAVQRGLRRYLKANKYGCVMPEDLWEHFDDEARTLGVIPDNETVGTLMATWSDNQGFPLVTVTRDKHSLKLEQSRLVFFLPDDSPDQKWWVPLSFTTSSERNFSKITPRLWMDPSLQATYLNISLAANQWIVFNIDQSGYYRVLYDNLTWAALSKQLLADMKLVPPLTRAKLIDDVFTLAFFKKLHYSVPLTLSRYLKQETHYYPWSAAIRALDNIHFYIKSTDINVKFEKYLLKLVDKVFDALTNLDDYNDSFRDNNSKLLQAKILHFACNLGHKPCELRALHLAQRLLLNDQQYIREHVDEINPLMCTMVRLGGERIWELAMAMYKQEKVHKPKEELMEALKCSTNRVIWKRLTRNYLDNKEDYGVFDLFTTSIHDKKSYCYVVEVIEEILDENNERIEELSIIIQDISGVPMPEKCRDKLRGVVEKYIESGEEQEEMIKALEKSTKPWLRLREIQQWFDEEANSVDTGLDTSDSADNSFQERSLYDGMNDMMELPYPHFRPHDYDYELRHGSANQINKSASSTAATQFDLFVLTLAVLPTPLYLTYLLFAPLL